MHLFKRLCTVFSVGSLQTLIWLQIYGEENKYQKPEFFKVGPIPIFQIYFFFREFHSLPLFLALLTIVSIKAETYESILRFNGGSEFLSSEIELPKLRKMMSHFELLTQKCL